MRARVEAAQNGRDLKLNTSHQLLVYAGDINLLDQNLTSIEKNTEALLLLARDGVEVNGEKSKCIFMSYLQNVGDNCNITTM